jgi:hypothetical protein
MVLAGWRRFLDMPIPDDFDPKPTIPTGGLDRMIQIWGHAIERAWIHAKRNGA